MKTCDNCGLENKNSATSCEFCGSPFPPKISSERARKKKISEIPHSQLPEHSLSPDEKELGSFKGSRDVFKKTRFNLIIGAFLPLILALIFAWLNYESSHSLNGFFPAIFGGGVYTSAIALMTTSRMNRFSFQSSMEITNERVFVDVTFRSGRGNTSHTIPLDDITKVKLIRHRSSRLSSVVLRIYTREYEEFLREFVASEGLSSTYTDPLVFSGEGVKRGTLRRFSGATLQARKSGVKFGVINLSPDDAQKAESMLNDLLSKRATPA